MRHGYSPADFAVRAISPAKKLNYLGLLRLLSCRSRGFSGIRIQDQPFQVLQLLLERPGELVTREELQIRIWAHDTFVDFDQSLNRAINKVRDVLSDTAGAPHFIETLPGEESFYRARGSGSQACAGGSCSGAESVA